MRTKISYIKKAFPILVSGIFILLLSACGTHNNGYGDTDGIYTSEKTSEANDDCKEVDKTNYYKQYFKSKNGTYDELPEEGAIFTDIEAYSTTDTLDEDGYIVTEEINKDYGAWGSNSDNVTVNVYNYGGYGYSYWHRPYWYGGWGYPSTYGHKLWLGLGLSLLLWRLLLFSFLWRILQPILWARIWILQFCSLQSWKKKLRLFFITRCI